MYTAQEDKIIVLASFLTLDTTDIVPSTYDENMLDVGSGEYLVLDDDEATEYATNYIRESVWAFNAWFLARYMPDGIDAEAIDDMRGDRCEAINPTFISLLGDSFEIFVDDAISEDGRGHFMSSYDGEEHESDGYYIYRIN